VKCRFAHKWTEDELHRILSAVAKLKGRHYLDPQRGIGAVSKAAWWKAFILVSRDLAISRNVLIAMTPKKLLESGLSPEAEAALQAVMSKRFTFKIGLQAFRNQWKAIAMAAGVKGLSCNPPTVTCGGTRRGRVPRWLVDKAARLYASGMKLKGIGKAVGQSENFVRRLRERHAELWQKAVDSALSESRERVRRLAGTNVVTEMEGYLARASHAERWARRKGEDVFPQKADAKGGQYTLSQFFEQYYRPVCLVEASSESVKHYQSVLRNWAMLTGDPCLCEITNETLAKYRDAIMSMDGQRSGKPLSVHTIRTRLNHIQILLDKAGPPCKGNRDAAGYILHAPWVKLPRAVDCEPRTVPEDHIVDCYRAAERMPMPCWPCVTAPAWWRALIVVAYNVGLRARTLFELKLSDLDFEHRTIHVRPQTNKGRKDLWLPMNEIVHSHLLAIRGDREFVFDWPFSREMFRRYLKRLQREAGLEPSQYFGLHQLRKTCATVLWESDPAAAQLMLGHSSLQITQQHYVRSLGILTKASAAMPQPAAFAGVGREAAT
jgi:integrase